MTFQVSIYLARSDTKNNNFVLIVVGALDYFSIYEHNIYILKERAKVFIWDVINKRTMKTIRVSRYKLFNNKIIYKIKIISKTTCFRHDNNQKYTS